MTFKLLLGMLGRPLSQAAFGGTFSCPGLLVTIFLLPPITHPFEHGGFILVASLGGSAVLSWVMADAMSPTVSDLVQVGFILLVLLLLLSPLLPG